MRILFFFLLTSTVLIFISCESKDNKSSLSEDLTYKMISYYKISDGCADLQNGNCAEIKIEFPIITLSENKVVEEIINESIVTLFSQDILGSIESTNFDSLMNGFIQDYESFRQEFPDATQSWVVERLGEVKLNKENIFSIDYTEYAYTGGAHPNTYVSFKNFNLINGEEITLDELIPFEKQKELTKIAEQEFREMKDLNPDADLGKEGFWFEDNEFSLIDNFLITDSSLVFYYNNYDITAYAFGPTELVIPFSRIKLLVEEKSILKGLIK